MLRVGDNIVRGVLEAAKGGRDPLGVGNGGDMTFRAVSQCDGALDGVDAETAGRIAGELAKAKVTRTRGMDLLTARIMAASGTDPLVMAWLAHVCGGPVHLLSSDLTDDGPCTELDDVVDHDRPANATKVVIGEAVWHARGIIEIPALPHTMSQAVVGRRLSEIVSHGILDEHPFTISEAIVDDEGVQLVLDHRGPWPDRGAATVEQMLALGPCGCR